MNKKHIQARAIRIVIALGLSATLLGLSLTVNLATVGSELALLSVGLRRPQSGTAVLIDRTERTTAAAQTSTTVVSPVVLGDIHQQTVTIDLQPTVTVPIPSGGGKVLTKQLSSGSSFVEGVAVKNNIGGTIDIAAALKHTPAIPFDNTTRSPQVLIVHTHTTECYLTHDDGVYSKDDATRNTDETKNMVAVGKAVAAQLKMAGIGVIHDTTIHDQPYNGAYSHSKAQIEKILKEYPSICVVLDLHRDAIYPDDTTRIKPTAVINGKKAAQMMIIVGMMNTKSVPNPHTKENLSLGVRLQQQLHTDHPGLMRPLNLANARYNQQLTNGSLLVEMGSDVNTLEEAVYSGELLGKGLIQVLRNL